MYKFEETITYEAIQLNQSISGYADQTDWLIVGSDGSQKVMTNDDFTDRCLQKRNENKGL